MEETMSAKKVLTNSVADQIIQIILDRRLKAGDRIPTEVELMGMMNVGRNTVREAIKSLTSRNILVVKQGAGTFVADDQGIPEDPLGLTFIGDDSQLALELSDVRLLIEPAIAEAAATHASDEEVAHMIDICAEIKHLAEEGASYIEKDLELHQYISDCCGNSILRNLGHILTGASSVSIHITKDRYRDVAFTEHNLIVQAIKRRDPIGARYAMVRHLSTGREDIAEQTSRIKNSSVLP